MPPRVSSSKPACDATWSAIPSALFTLSSVDSNLYETRCGAVIKWLVFTLVAPVRPYGDRIFRMEQFACSERHLSMQVFPPGDKNDGQASVFLKTGRAW